MKVGRNDPCPCGSGKKYKKCCMEKDQAEGRRRARLTPSPPARPVATPRPPGSAAAPQPQALTVPLSAPSTQTPQQRLETFKKATYESRFALFERTINDGLMDAEMARSALELIRPECIQRGDRELFERMLSTLRRRRPEAFDANANVYLQWSIADGLVACHYDAVAVRARELARIAPADLAGFQEALDRLCYHDQLATVVKTLRVAWRGIKEARNVPDRQKQSFTELVWRFELYEYLERTRRPDAAERALLGQLEYYGPPDVDRIDAAIRHLTGQAEGKWLLEDFADAELVNLEALSAQFVGYLRRDRRVSYARGDLAASGIADYLRRRRRGELTPGQPSLWAGTGSTRRAGRQPPPVEQPLCPDAWTMDAFLAGLLHSRPPRHHAAAAVAEAIPAWGQFLTSCGLMEEDQCTDLLAELRELTAPLRRILQRDSDDPAPAKGVSAAWAGPGDGQAESP